LAGAEVNWLDVYEYATAKLQPVSGTYHDNYIVTGWYHEACLIRVPKKLLAPDVEPRMFTEPAVLQAAQTAMIAAPRLLHSSLEPEFQVHTVVPGQPLSIALPDAGPVPAVVTAAISQLMRNLSEVAVDIRPAPVPGQPWADVPAGDSAGFSDALLTWLSGIYAGAGEAALGFLSEVGIWHDPFAEVKKYFRPSPRPFRLCHGDLGRANIMLDPEGDVNFIDWELAVWGDPLWDIAAHLHRMRYPGTQNKFVRQELLASCRGFTGLNSQYDELRTYLYVELCRSLVLDAIRDLAAIGAGLIDNAAGAAAQYAAKLSQASVTSASAAGIKALYLKYGARACARCEPPGNLVHTFPNDRRRDVAAGFWRVCRAVPPGPS
jgi:aminoglycoside phosphotransferase (APT) family kinase protein